MDWISFFGGFVSGLVALKLAGSGACRKVSGSSVPSKPAARKPSSSTWDTEPKPLEGRPPKEAVDLGGEPENKIVEGIREQDY